MISYALKEGKYGFTAYQLKWIALAFMTIDHLGAYGSHLPVISSSVPFLRMLGRIAAPLFLLLIVESMRHTRSKPKFILRLYSAGVLTGLFTTATNLFFGEIIGIFTPGNILFTYFYTVLYIYLIENLICAIQLKNLKKVIIFIIALVSTYVPYFLFQQLHSLNSPQWPIWLRVLFSDCLNSFLSSPLLVEYSLLFVFMGVLLYFINQKFLRCILFLIFCALSFLGASTAANLWPFNDFFSSQQFWMILALPFFLLYNGKRGAQHKLFFYLYYPLHRYFIFILNTIV